MDVRALFEIKVLITKTVSVDAHFLKSQSKLNKYWLDLEFTDIIKVDIAECIHLSININNLKYISILLLSFNHSENENMFMSLSFVLLMAQRR